MRNVGLSSCSTSSMTPMLWMSCKFGDMNIPSGLRAGTDMSIDEDKLPGVPLDMAESRDFTVACGSLTVVTGSSPLRVRIFVFTSDGEPVGRPDCLDGVCEKKRGE